MDRDDYLYLYTQQRNIDLLCSSTALGNGDNLGSKAEEIPALGAFTLMVFTPTKSPSSVSLFSASSPGATSLPSLPQPPPSPYHPSGSSQCTSPKHPVSCIEPGLATRFIYDIIHVSMPFSQIIPPSPSPTESKRLFSTPVSLLHCFPLYSDL